MSSDEHEPRSIYLFGSANGLVNIAYVYSSPCKSAQSVCSFCVKNGLVSPIISSASVFIQPCSPALHELQFSLVIHDSFKDKRDVRWVQGP